MARPVGQSDAFLLFFRLFYIVWLISFLLYYFSCEITFFPQRHNRREKSLRNKLKSEIKLVGWLGEEKVQVNRAVDLKLGLETELKKEAIVI